ncbi:MAG: UDP-N-acetylmuramate--L-alanine ligase [Clostridia bacterium]|nr:UDP-N-acetylmuramate--L-alanine ligase [Clostridia bacterium]
MNNFENILSDINKKIHMIGIGGVSMSGIADILLNMGFSVSGSDMVRSAVTDRLEKQGINITIGHFAENVHGSDIVVYTAAVKSDNPEIVEAKNLNLTLVERSDFLGAITHLYSETIAISGTHGKTTTTSMLSSVFIEAQKDPSIQVGADLRILNDLNYRIGKSDIFIVEACEYVRSFLKFFPKTAIVLNIEEDHLDCYKDLNDIKNAFNQFLNIPNDDGLLILNADDSDCMDIADNHKAKLVTFGIDNKNATWHAENIGICEDGTYKFDAVSETETIENVKLGVIGYHNIYNALSVIACSKEYAINNEDIKNGIVNFKGASRRFELVGQVNGANIYDDYAHHPTEIKATIKSAKNIKAKKIWAIFQPHTYTRTYTLFDEFVTAFEGADTIIITDIYAAREIDTGIVSAKQLADKINEISGNCIYISKLEDVASYLKENVSEGEIVLTIGAGTVTKIGRELL